MRILWVQEVAALQGGCERYVWETVGLLRERGVRSTLLYDPNQPTETVFLEAFDEAYPMVEVAAQVRSIRPDAIFVHRLDGAQRIREIAVTGVPTARFFHDHKMFCPRQHKYTAFGRETCTSRVGVGCFKCAGCLVKTASGLGVVTPWAVERELAANRGLGAFIVGSTYMAEHLALHDFDTARIHTVPLFTRMPAERFPVEREDDLLLFVGTLTTGKGIDTLLQARALARTPSRVAIVGAGKFEAEYRALTASLGLDAHVTFVGRVEPAGLGAWYRRAAAVVMPSRTPETFGLVGAEALAHGTPVIGCAVGGVGEWLHDGHTGISVGPNDPAALASAMDRIVRDPAQARVLGENGRHFARTRLTPERHADGLLAALCALAGKEFSRAA